MGEVDRAEDTKLEREVSIRVLPYLFTADPGCFARFARFRREAHVSVTLDMERR